MEIKGIYPKDVYVDLELSLTEVEMILNFLDRVDMNYDSEEDPEIAEAVKFVTKKFFPQLNAMTEEIKRQNMQG